MPETTTERRAAGLPGDRPAADRSTADRPTGAASAPGPDAASAAAGPLGWWRPRHLRHRIGLVQSVAILTAVGLVAVAVAGLSASLIPRLAAIEDRVWAARLAPWFEDHYAAHGGWTEVVGLLGRLGRPLPPDLLGDLGPALPWQPDPRAKLAGERYLLLDPQGRVLAAAGPGAAALPVGALLPATLLRERALALRVDGTLVGYLLASSGLMGDPALDAFRLVLWKTLASAGVLAAALAFAASQFLARRITRPLERLAAAAQALREGRPHTPLAAPGVDEVAQTARAFDAMAVQLQRQRRLREQLVADVAHELRTPITVMRLELDATQDGMQTPAAACGVLAGELDALDRLIEDLRLLSLADAGGLRLRCERLDLAPFLGDLAARWHDPGSGFAPRVAPIDPGLRVTADQARLRQVLDILIDNARRHGGAGAQVEIQARARPGAVEIQVLDDGPGIPPDQLAAVFERFHRVDASRSRAGGGTGLGLAIAARLIEQHGGTIRAESDGVRGTSIRIRLPAEV